MLLVSLLRVGQATIYIWSFLILLGMHIIATIVIFFRLKSVLKKMNLNGYKSVLGVYYVRIAELNGLVKYKWIIGLTEVQAKFDAHEQLVTYQIKPYRFFPIIYKQPAI